VENAAPGQPVDVFRDGGLITTVESSVNGTFFYTDSVGKLRGTFTYKVCYAAAPGECSNEVTVTYS
jgi:hypothetical protein